MTDVETRESLCKIAEELRDLMNRADNHRDLHSYRTILNDVTALIDFLSHRSSGVSLQVAYNIYRSQQGSISLGNNFT